MCFKKDLKDRIDSKSLLNLISN